MVQKSASGDKIVCHCLQVSEAAVLEAIRSRSLNCIKDISRYTQAGDGCTACHPLLREYLRTAGYLDSDPICSAK